MLKLVFKSVDIPEVHIQSYLTIGRDPSNDVVLPLPTVSGTHASLKIEGDSVILKDHDSTNGTYVNGKELSGEIEISLGDVIMFDKVVADLVNAELEDKPETPEADLFLRAETGSCCSEPVKLVRTTVYTVGRDPAAKISLSNQGVSWTHAKIFSKDGCWSIVDLNSTNGTFLNGERIKEANIVSGDQICFETVKFSVVDNVDADIEPFGVLPVEKQEKVAVEEIAHSQFLLINGEQLQLTSNKLSLGRMSGNDIVFDDMTVSSKHAFLSFEAGKWWVEDRHSKNGTMVNGSRVQRQSLLGGDSLSFGNQQVTFVDPTYVAPTTAPSVVIIVADD